MDPVRIRRRDGIGALGMSLTTCRNAPSTPAWGRRLRAPLTTDRPRTPAYSSALLNCGYRWGITVSSTHYRDEW